MKTEDKKSNSDLSKVKLRKHISKASIEVIKGSNQGDYHNFRNTPSRNDGRYNTPFASKQETSTRRRKNTSNVTERQSQTSKSRMNLLKEEIKDSLKSINEAYLANI